MRLESFRPGADATMSAKTCRWRSRLWICAGLIAHWPFDELDGGVATDVVGSLTGVLSSGASFVAGGVSGNAVALNRELNGFIDLGSVLELTNTSFSVAVWIKMNPGDTTENSLVFAKHESGWNNGYFINVNRSNAYIGQGNNASFFAATPSHARFHHQCQRWPRRHIDVYICGRFQYAFRDGEQEDVAQVLP